MATRDYLKHTVSTTEPTGSTLGDEWYDPSTNKIYKRLAVDGTTVEFREIPSALIIESGGQVVSQSTSTINFIGYTLTVDGDGTLNINVPTAGAAGSNTQIQFNNSGSLGATSNFTWNNSTQTLNITGFTTTFALNRSGNINAPSWTTTSPSFNSAAAILTDTTGSGTIAVKAGHSFSSPNFASNSVQTITNAANIYVNGAVASTNTTITNNWAIYNDGNMRVIGTLYNDTRITAGGPLVAWNTTTPGTTAGTIHLGTSSATANAGSAITFGARDSSSGSTAQAGIYINSDGAYGTRMYFATTNSYASGSTTGMWLDEAGRLRITRNVSSTSTTTGTLIVTGGVGISENLHVGGLAYSSFATVSAAGTTQATATALTATVSNVTVVAASSGVRLMVPAVAGTRILVRNGTATQLRVYPATGAQINTLGANAAFLLDGTTLLEFVAFSTTQWYTVNATFA